MTLWHPKDQDKPNEGRIRFGSAPDTYDLDGRTLTAVDVARKVIDDFLT